MIHKQHKDNKDEKNTQRPLWYMDTILSLSKMAYCLWLAYTVPRDGLQT